MYKIKLYIQKSILQMSSINSVVQIIVSQNGAKAFNAMVAGTGWFPENVPEGTMLTNAHVVHNAKSVFIRMPCAHSVDIPVYVQGMSTGSVERIK